MANLQASYEIEGSVSEISDRIDAIHLLLSKPFGKPRLPYLTINWEKAHGISY